MAGKTKISKKFSLTHFHLLPLFVVAVSMVFSIIFAIFLLPLKSVTTEVDIKFLFTTLMVFSAVVSSTVSIIFYLILSRKV